MTIAGPYEIGISSSSAYPASAHVVMAVSSVVRCLLSRWQCVSLVQRYARVEAARVMLIGCTLILSRRMDIRAGRRCNRLMAAWSLFYEYVANILYATCSADWQVYIGILTVLVAALLCRSLCQSRRSRRWLVGNCPAATHRLRTPALSVPGRDVAHALRRTHPRAAHFLVCSILLVAAFSMPRLGGPDHRWMNGLYESLCVLVLFPRSSPSRLATSEPKVLHWHRPLLRNLSYPLYISHYPLIYIFTARVIQDKIPLARELCGSGTFRRRRLQRLCLHEAL